MNLVYRDMDQVSLDYQYNNRAHVAEPQRYLDWYKTASETARMRVAHVRDIAYGPLPDERLDVFSPTGLKKNDRRPVVVFVHGGAWQHLNLAHSSFAAETFTGRGALYVPLGFTRMPAAGNLDQMVAQVRTAIAWVWKHIEDYGGERSRLYLLGHSSGAHLAAMGLVSNWPRLFGLPPNIVHGAVLVSGIYDLEPVRLSFRNEYLHLDRAMEIRNSPCRNLPTDGPPLTITYGELETLEFKRQANYFSDVWQRSYGNCREIEIKRVNHYEIIETLTDPQSHLTRATLELFSL